MLLRDEDEKGTVLFHSVIFNSVIQGQKSLKNHLFPISRNVQYLISWKSPQLYCGHVTSLESSCHESGTGTPETDMSLINTLILRIYTLIGGKAPPSCQ